MVETSLHKELRKKFLDKVEADAALQEVYKQITSGDGNYIVAEEYAYQIGNALTEVFQENLSTGNLNKPDLMKKFAESVLRPLLEEETDIVSKAAVQVQKSLNERANIGLKALEAPKPTDRINGLVEKVAVAEQYDDIAWVLDEPVKNLAQSVVSETMKTNVEMHGRAGLSPKIIREAESGCCKWCSALAGVYEYPVIEDDVYRRHERCRCSVDYDPGNGKKTQNVWTKQWKTAEEHAKINSKKSVKATEQSARNFSSRAMANGPRRGALTRVTAEEEAYIKAEADKLGIPREILRFNAGTCTSFNEELMVINVRGDVFPSQYAANPESILNARCALAHEYYGHFCHYPSRFPIGDWRDEFEASYRAAIDTPNLNDKERRMLMFDAFDRAKNANVSVMLNKEARRIIYGTEE